MAANFQGVIGNAGIYLPAAERRKAEYAAIYNEHRHRIYSLAFWMTDHEMAAEQLAANTFLRAFAGAGRVQAEQIDLALLAELRELMPVGPLTLNAVVLPAAGSIRGTMKRVHLERAVTQLPATERLVFLLHDVESYDHARIARLLGISESESRFGLHQARMQVREQVSPDALSV